MGRASKQLVVSSLWISQETFQKGAKGVGRKVKVKCMMVARVVWNGMVLGSYIAVDLC